MRGAALFYLRNAHTCKIGLDLMMGFYLYYFESKRLERRKPIGTVWPRIRDEGNKA